jgi:hypothetical protein
VTGRDILKRIKEEPMDFLTLAKERYSCRKFSGKAVEQESWKR